MEAMKKTTVVIPNYNGSRYLENCIRSLIAGRNEKEQDGIEKAEPYGLFDILVIDNGSSDGSELLVDRLHGDEKLQKELERSGIGLSQISYPENTGFCKAVNTGIRVARTPYVLLLNNDTEVLSGFVQTLTEVLERDPGLFSVSARMRSLKEPEKLDDAGDLYCALGWAFARGKGKPVEEYSRRAYIFAACGGAAIYRRELLLGLGCFDENHFAYLEDIDVAFRALICGFRNLYEPGAEVLHVGSATTGSAHNPFKVRLSARNSIYLFWKNLPFLQLLLNLPFFLAGCVVKYVYFCKKGMGSDYRKGLCEGIALCGSKEGREHKVRFRMKNLKNYIRIQWQLWINILQRCR